MTRRRQQAIELHRRRGGVAGGEFSAGGDADALLHRCEAIAVIGIENRPCQARIAERTEMAVIAAFDGERQLDAERSKQVGRPRTERHHRRFPVDRALRGFDSPLGAHRVQASGVARDGDAAEGRKTCRICAGDGKRIG